MSIIRLCLSSKAGAKVDNLSITSKYIGLFFYSFLKLFCNSLIDNDVIEYIFSDRHILIWKPIHYYIVHSNVSSIFLYLTEILYTFKIPRSTFRYYEFLR